MNNLPIANNSMTQASGNAAQTAQAADPVAGLFAALLAQQIGEHGLPRDGLQLAAAPDGSAIGVDAELAVKDTVEPEAVTMDARETPATMLAAMLLQFPQEAPARSVQTGAAADVTDNPVIPAGRRNNKATEAAVIGIGETKAGSKVDAATLFPGNQEVAIRALEGNALKLADPAQPAAAAAPGNPAAISALEVNALKLAERAMGYENTTPAPAVVASATATNMPVSIRAADNHPQLIGAPLGSAAWPEEFSQKIVWMGTQQNQVAELQLNPPNLGPLNVVLKISDNQASVLFTSPHGAVRDSIENALPKLREMLADNGITLGNATVSDQPPRDRSAEGFMNQDRGANRHHTMNNEESKMPDQVLKTIQDVPMRRHNGMVDIFA
jgi:flagellar hook-length control protein FliK